jgi:putative nucleotidyltransferase with HDIG domain
MRINTFFEKLSNNHSGLYRSFLAILCIASIVYLFPKQAKFRFEYQQNKPWMHEDLIAPFDFAIEKSPEQINTEKQNLIKSNKPYFKFNESIKEIEKIKLDSLFEKKWQQSIYSNNKYAKDNHYKILNKIINQVYDKGIIQINDKIEAQNDDFELLLIKNNIADEAELADFYTLKTAYIFAETEFQKEKNIDRTFINELLENLLVQNVTFDSKRTLNEQDNNLKNLSLSKGMKYKGQRIISRGDMVDEEKLRWIESLKQEYLEQSGGNENNLYILLGQTLIVSLGVLMIILFLFSFRPEILLDNAKFSFILLLIFMISAMASLSLNLNLLSIYIFPYCILPILVRAFLDTRTALFTHLAVALIVGQITPSPFEFTYIQLIGGIFAVFSIVNLRNRSQLFISVGIIFVAYCLAYLALAFTREGKFSSLDIVFFESFAISAGLTLFAYPLIFIFEKLFGFISDVSLMELSDINSPLLRELALKAPGTFQHSLQVANLAEEAIIKIGGSSLLARVGALYHDIGKSETPMYFVENQYTGVNPHSELSYQDSASIIIGHVILGIEKAKANNLPDTIIDFIRTHHGTTMAEYFYKMAKVSFPEEEIDEKIFHYPGPIPYSIETAVVMMADAVEASGRSIKKFDAETIDALVEKIINHQIEQNQFVNSPITFRNVNTIKKVFKKRLLNMNHLRIEYPK